MVLKSISQGVGNDMPSVRRAGDYLTYKQDRYENNEHKKLTTNWRLHNQLQRAQPPDQFTDSNRGIGDQASEERSHLQSERGNSNTGASSTSICKNAICRSRIRILGNWIIKPKLYQLSNHAHTPTDLCGIHHGMSAKTKALHFYSVE